MPVLDLNREAIAGARAEYARLRDAQRRARADLDAAQRELDRLRRGGADERTLAQAAARVEQLTVSARGGDAGLRDRLQSIRSLSDTLLAQRDPATMVQALDAAHPVLLMPVAIQTRYDDATTRLMIRIYPDVVHAYQHDPGLTPQELVAVQRYWAQRFASPADSASPWKELSLPYGPMRAAYLVRAVAPTNLAELGRDGAPVFDDAAIPRSAGQAREQTAAALPDRFVAVGWRGGVEVLRKWGRVVADVLPMSPLFDPLLAPSEPEAWDPFAGDRAWLVDYAAAEEAGMAITVTAADLKAGATLLQGLDRLVVIGVDWTQTPETAAALVADLLHNHEHGQGLAFVAQGTPTNNTGSARAGFAADGRDLAAALDPVAAQAQAEAAAQAAPAEPAPVPPDELAGAGARLQLLLGLPPVPEGGVGFDARRVPGAALQEGAASGHMVNALWSATLGYTLRYFWNPVQDAESLIDDAAIETLRAHAVRFLRPGGPLSALRIGRQPYGLLPVCARGYRPRPDSALERELRTVLGWLRGFWQAAVPRVPTMKTADAETLHQVLAMQPWSVAKRFLQVAGPAAVENYADLKDVAASQRLLNAFMVADLLDRWPRLMPFIALCAVRPKAHSLDAVAWVQRDPANPKQELAPAARLARDYLASLIELLSSAGQDPRAALVAMQDADSLLEALLAFAADEEVLASGRRLFYGHLQTQTLLSPAAKAAALRLRPAEYVGVDHATLVGDQFQLGHAGALMGLRLIGTTGDQSVGQYIGVRLGGAVAGWPEELHNIASFRDSLAFLQQRSVGELDHALRTTLDAAAFRLDAWITSLATKRLDGLRERSPGGLHLGAFGVVEDLKPDARLRDQRLADSMGYVHAPSLHQATTAAVLRSGHLANREHAEQAFDIDLRSRRVKRAKRLLEGVANGQALTALLGYRFERALRDHDLSQHILEYRRRFPYRPSGNTPETGEDIGARDVVDGLRLATEAREQGADAVRPAAVPAEDHLQAMAFVDDLADLVDAVSDLLVSESVHQLVGGNLDGSAAAMSALDKQTRPPEPRVTRTPRSTRGYTQRVAVVLGGGDAGEWAALEDLQAQVEPRLNAWLARLLGAPARWRFDARLVERVPSGEVYDGRPGWRWVPRDERLQAGIDELGLSPLSLVLGGEPQQHGGQSRVQEALAAVLAAKARAAFGADAERLTIVLEADAPADAPAGSAGLVEFESFCWLLRQLLEKARALRRMDMVLARDGVERDALLAHGDEAGVDLAELQARLAPAETRALQVLGALGVAAAAPPDDAEALDPAAPDTRAMLAALHAALADAAALGWRSATATEPAGAAGPAPDSVAAARDRARALHAEMQARLDAAPAAEAGDGLAEQVRKTVARVHAIFGAAFPVLPVFTLGGYAGEVAASLAERATLLDGDELAIAGWLPKLGCVHEGAGRLADVLSAAEARGLALDGGDFQLVQMGAPGVTPVRRWGALPPAEGDDLRGVVAVAAYAPGSLQAVAPDSGFAGLFVDEWSETIPSTEETTGLSFHFDAPGARAPQTMLLAVPSDPAAEQWTLDELLAVVDEALALARLRAVRPQDLHGLGNLLPGLMLSNNFRRDVPSVDFAAMLERNLAALRAAYGEHSARSVMTMAAGKLVASE